MKYITLKEWNRKYVIRLPGRDVDGEGLCVACFRPMVMCDMPIAIAFCDNKDCSRYGLYSAIVNDGKDSE